MRPWEPCYITSLSVVSFGAALATIGLVRPWGVDLRDLVGTLPSEQPDTLDRRKTRGQRR